MSLARFIAKRRAKFEYFLEDRRLRRQGLRRSRWERQYPQVPGTMLGLDPDHVFRYSWAQPFCRGKTVLDYGCGVGYGSFLLSDVARHVRGYDISADALEWAKYYAEKSANLEYSADLPGECFDCITCFECVEHVESPEGLIDWIAEHVRGYAFISTPEARPQKWSPFHTKEFTREEFLSTLQARFEIEHVEEQLTNGCTVILARCKPRVTAPAEQ